MEWFYSLLVFMVFAAPTKPNKGEGADRRFVQNQLMSATETKTWTIAEIYSKAHEKELKNIVQLFKDIEIVPVTDRKSEHLVFQVKSVAKGSVYERAGVKPGDYMRTK
ncbi:MAG: hypothetical protein H6623_07725 [Bdellovibrionaceae bacterium]|nr:hypothetical protein [Pseudobdellovibrionaceae bacterium]